MFQKLKAKFLNLNLIVNYRKILPYVKPYWGRALTAVLITIPIGSMDAVIAWALKPYMDVVMVEKNTMGSSTFLIPLLIIVFSLLQSLLTYSATYLNTWVGQRIAMDVKKKLFYKLTMPLSLIKTRPETSSFVLTMTWMPPAAVC